MSEIVKKLRERRSQVWEQMNALASAATEENRQFSSDEQGQWDAQNEELDTLDKRIKSALDTEQRAKEADEVFARIEKQPTAKGGGVRSHVGGGDVNEELRSFLRGEGPRFFEVKPDGPVNYRALAVGSGTGGDTVPTNFYDRLVEHLIQNAGIMQAGVTVINTSGGEVIQVPKTTAHSTAQIVSEGTAIAASDPAFGQVSLGAYKYGTLVQVSRELLDDTGVDLEGYLARETGRALGNAFGGHAVSGDGSGKPRGVLTDALQAISGGTAGAPTYDNVVDTFYSVIAPYRQSQSCHWFMNDATVGVLRKIKDTTGQPIWQPSMQVGAPDLLLGKPVLTDPNMPTVASGAKSVLFGDFSRYFVRMAGGIRFERSDDYAFSSDLVTFRALMRADAATVDLTGALKYFVGA